MNKVIKYGLIISLGIIIGFILRGSFSAPGSSDVGNTGQGIGNIAENFGDEVPPVWVEVSEAIKGDIVEYITEVGITEAFRSVVVSAEATGRLAGLDLKIGDFVSEGDTIAFIDDELARLALSSSKAQLINSSATYEKAGKDLARYGILLDNEEISESEFETIRVQHELARSNYLRDEAAVDISRRHFRNTRITSPISGYIAEKNVQSGNMISVNQPVIKVVDISQVKINISVSEQDIGNLRNGLPAALQVDAFPGREFAGTVYSISPEANRDTHTFPVQIIVRNNQQPRLRSGMVVRVSMEKNILKDVTLISRDAVIDRFGETKVFVLTGQYVTERSVSLGLEKDDLIQVISGVEPGETVVVVGQYSLQDGSSVRIR